MNDTDTDSTVTEDQATTDATDTEDTSSDESTEADDQDDDGDTFPREYVEKLRGQNAKYRDRAKVADTYAKRLHTQLVAATGRLADPSDLEFDEDHLDDLDTLTAAIDDLLTRKPHLATRKPVGDIGQGQRGNGPEPFSLLGMLKERT